MAAVFGCVDIIVEANVCVAKTEVPQVCRRLAVLGQCKVYESNIEKEPLTTGA